MSASNHEAEAQGHDKTADEHAAAYDPNATKRHRCGAGDASSKFAPSEPCWTSETNPTAEHLKEAEAHRKMAADHRAAMMVLRDAEVKSCSGISDADRDESPFSHRADIVTVTQLETPSPNPKTSTKLVSGASVTVRAVAGLTKEYLQSMVNCHLARNASMGFAMPEMAWCPLAAKGATANVESTNGSFRVDIKGDNEQTGLEIWKRAHALVPSS